MHRRVLGLVSVSQERGWTAASDSHYDGQCDSNVVSEALALLAFSARMGQRVRRRLQSRWREERKTKAAEPSGVLTPFCTFTFRRRLLLHNEPREPLHSDRKSDV